MARTEIISTVLASSNLSSALSSFAKSRAIGPNAAWTVAFGTLEIEMKARSFQVMSAPIVEAWDVMRRTITPTSNAIKPYSTTFGSKTAKFTSFPIKLNEIGFKNFQRRSKYMGTSLWNVGSRCFILFQPVPATNATVTHPSAPAEGYWIALLPKTATAPASVIIVNRRPLTYFCLKWKIIRIFK